MKYLKEYMNREMQLNANVQQLTDVIQEQKNKLEELMDSKHAAINKLQV